MDFIERLARILRPLPVRSVGVMGDDRTYENVLAIRCVSSVDGMTS